MKSFGGLLWIYYIFPKTKNNYGTKKDFQNRFLKELSMDF
jgi:hypothetical protein